MTVTVSPGKAFQNVCSMDGTVDQQTFEAGTRNEYKTVAAGQHCLPSLSTKTRVHYCTWQAESTLLGAAPSWSLWRGEAKAGRELAKSRANSRRHGMPVRGLTLYIQTKEKVKKVLGREGDPEFVDLGSLLGELGKADHSLAGGPNEC